MSILCLKPIAGGVKLSIQVVPRSSRNEISELLEEKCKIKIKAPPVEGEANHELIEFLAKIFGVSKKNIRIVSGASSKGKSVEISGIDVLRTEEILLQSLKKKP
ncbi:MAG: YggU family protein [Candidatus Riflebacteria bacterium]|nr:YggU family protein [Candidatus Riflebacteria bacterium]